MGARENLQRLIERKRLELSDLEASVRDAHTYIEALTDAMKALPKDTLSNGSSEPTLRPGTMVHQVREIIRQNKRPLHITEILQALDRPIDKNNRVSVSGSIAAYVRNNQIFTRPKPNTFGLLEMESPLGAEGTADTTIDDELPSTFGQ